MRKNRRKSGFTLGELLIVVAIIGVLSGVAFAAVVQHQKRLTQVELDGIAKEIFVAAQNHLTMAENEDYLGIGDQTVSGTSGDGSVPSVYGTAGTSDADKEGIYYFHVNRGDLFGSGTLLDMMLPFGSVDETVRMGGSYIIRYQPSSAMVLDVFYCAAETIPDTVTTLSGDDKKGARFNNNPMVGWYGGVDAVAKLASSVRLDEPAIEIVNAERLTVRVTDPNAGKTENGNPVTGIELQLIVSGIDNDDNQNNDPKKAFLLSEAAASTNDRVTYDSTKKEYTVVLDDITASGLRFANIAADTTNQFVSGQDISIQAVAYSSSALMNIAYSDVEVTNSLYEKVEKVNADTVKASINNFRHLENLDPRVSNVNQEATGSLNLNAAVQTTDLDWFDFRDAVKTGAVTAEQVVIYSYPEGTATPTSQGCYLPVSLSYKMEYDGQNHNVKNVKAQNTGDSGLFGTVSYTSLDGAKSVLSNLALIDFDITVAAASESGMTAAAGNAGALAGSLTNTNVTNVLAYNSKDEASGATRSTNITATTDNAGGLVGSMTNGSMTYSTAALYVQGGTNAGGLIGSANGAAIEASYSGGHTTRGFYSLNKDETSINHYNVEATGTAGKAGGLIGTATGSTTVDCCYSTCSTTGATAGGLIGDAANIQVNNCYAAGMVVKGSGSAGAFLGSGTVTTGAATANGVYNNYYVGGVSDGALPSGTDKATVFSSKSTLYTVLVPAAAVGGSASLEAAGTAFPAIEARDASAAYDGKQVTVYKGKYPYLTIEQMAGYNAPTNQDGTALVPVPVQLTRHYGDWQAPVVDCDLEIDNAEFLTAKLKLPADQLYDGMEFSVLIRGETSKMTKDGAQVPQDAYLVMSVNKNGTDYVVSLQPATDIPGLYAASDTTEENKKTKRDAWLKKTSFNAATNDAAVTVGYEDDAKTKAVISFNLDSIVKPGSHFAQLFPTYIPGENLTIAADGSYATLTDLQAIVESNPRVWTKSKSTIITNSTGGTGSAGGAGSTGSTDPGTTETTRTIAARTNSLFANPKDDASGTTPVGGSGGSPVITTDGEARTEIDYTSTPQMHQAAIANIRHLENLDGSISGLNSNNTATDGIISAAKQAADLMWDGTSADEAVKPFLPTVRTKAGLAVDAAVIICGLEESNVTTANCFLPVNPSYLSRAAAGTGGGAASTDTFVPYALKYEGEKPAAAASGSTSGGSAAPVDPAAKYHSISGVVVKHAGNAGLFGALPAMSSVNGLVLIDFDVQATGAENTGNAGTLAGELAGIAQSGETPEQRVTVNTVFVKASATTPNSKVTLETASGNAGGLVGKSGTGTIINIMVQDTTVEAKSGAANAGGMIGLSENDGMINAVAYNTKDFDTSKALAATVQTGTDTATTAANGSAGGLIGRTNSSSMQKCAAALVVNSAKGNAGGLIGTANGGTLTGCYSGGHTSNGGYYKVETSGSTTTSTPIYNVTAAGTAGGLIGVAGSDEQPMGEVTYCYSTCSATGNVAGGFVGEFKGTSLSNCYATGLVSGTGTGDTVSVTENNKTRSITIPKDGAFAYTLSLPPTSPAENCMYFGIINERYEEIAKDSNNSTVTVTAPTTENAKTSFFYLAALGSNGTSDGIKELDADAATYEGFVGAVTEWTDALPYDSQLATYYGSGSGTARVPLFNLKSAERLGMTDIVNPSEATATIPADFVATHYGDWPAPELFVVNKQ